MKRLLLLIIIPFLSFGQDLTYVPDDGFEYWIETNIDGASNGDINDNYVFTDALQNNTNSVSITQTIPIYDLTGIEDFIIRQSLVIDDLYISEIDLSDVDFRYYWNNYPSLSIFDNQYLEEIILPKDTASWLSIQDNFLLENLVFQDESAFGQFALRRAPLLCEIVVRGRLDDLANNWNADTDISLRYQLESLQSIDLSYLTNTNFGTKLELAMSFPSLSYINLNNGAPTYNWELSFINSFCAGGGNLCVEVGSPELCEDNNDWPQETGLICTGSLIDINYTTTCNAPDCSTIGIVEAPTITKSLIKRINILGRETNNNKGFQLHIYDDGSVEKKYLVK